MNYSPIIISVYNRFEHLKKCVNSLKKNEIATQTELFVVSDAAARKEDEFIITEIRSYVKNISGFKKITLIENETNKGGNQSVFDARKVVFQKYDRVIMLEDDIEVSPYFLDYINKGLSLYRDNPRVFAVSAYHYGFPISEKYPYDVYFMAAYPAWGIGIWKKKNEQYDNEVTSRFNSFIEENKSNLELFKKLSYSSYKILLRDIKGEITAGDVRRAFYQLCKGMVTVIPVKSLTKSIGHDGSGEHCPYDYLLQNQQIESVSREYRFPEEVFIDSDIYRRRKFFSSNFSKKLRTIKRIYYNLIKRSLLRVWL